MEYHLIAYSIFKSYKLKIEFQSILFKFLYPKEILWVPISSTGKISDSCTKDLGFNPRLHQKLIDVLV